MNEAEAADKAIFQSSDSLRSAASLPYAKSVTFNEPLKLELGGQLPEVPLLRNLWNAERRAQRRVHFPRAQPADSHVRPARTGRLARLVATSPSGPARRSTPISSS